MSSSRAFCGATATHSSATVPTRVTRKRDRYPSLATAKGFFTSAYGFTAQAAEVKVDTATGEVQLVRAVTFHDCGYPLNRQLVDGQVEGYASTGQGQALS